MGRVLIIPLPGGGQYDTSNDPSATEFSGVRLHVPLALSRLTEFWRSKPNMIALQSDYAAEMQLLENAIWDVITQRLLPYAAGVNLNVLGAIVGQSRGGLTDPQYRARIQVRIRINRSFGRPTDVLEVLGMLSSDTFAIYESTAAFLIDYTTVPTADLTQQLAAIVRETRAAGIRAIVQVPTDLTRGAIYEWPATGLGSSVGWGYPAGDPNVGGFWGFGMLA